MTSPNWITTTQRVRNSVEGVVIHHRGWNLFEKTTAKMMIRAADFEKVSLMIRKMGVGIIEEEHPSIKSSYESSSGGGY